MESGHETENNGIDKNEPAFPCEWTEETEELKGLMVKRKFGTTGMTLRDYFAAKVFAGLVGQNILTKERYDFIATISYSAADAMLEARSK